MCFKVQMLANALNTIGINKMLSILVLIFFIPLILLIHLIATIYFQKKGRYRSKNFTIKYLIVAMLAPIAGSALITFEYLANMSKAGIHIGTFLSILFVYGFLSLIFAIPYVLYLSTSVKTP